MSTAFEINLLLESKLNELSNKPDIAWPNFEYTPNVKTSYFQPYVITGLPQKIGNSDSDKFLTISLFQIDIYTPKGKGAKTSTDYINALATHFPVGLELFTATNGYKLRVQRTYDERPGKVMGSHYVVPFLVQFETVTD